jgi:hypothetical protein
MGKSGRKPSTEMQSLVKSEQQTAEETLSFQFKNQYLQKLVISGVRDYFKLGCGAMTCLCLMWCFWIEI